MRHDQSPCPCLACSEFRRDLAARHWFVAIDSFAEVISAHATIETPQPIIDAASEALRRPRSDEEASK